MARLLVATLFAGTLAACFAPAQSDPSTKEAVELKNSIGMKFRPIAPGKFTMGAPAAEGRGNDTAHAVEISRAFHLGTYTVTQAEYEKIIGKNPSTFSKTGLNRFRVEGIDTKAFPVETVSWEQAVAFCKALSALPDEKKAGRVYRLPTEAEWEYACRAGTTTPYTFGASLSSTQANINGTLPAGDSGKGIYLQRPCPVGSFKPNAWGLYDMHGNVWQWTADWYARDYYTISPKVDPTGPSSGDKRVLRGGSWLNRGNTCRATDRLALEPDEAYNNVGFRIACDVKKGS